MKYPGFYTIILCLSVCLVCLPRLAYSHRLNVFAWQENNSVIVESNFGENRPARNAVVTVTLPDSQEVILSGKTDDTGVFSFPLQAAKTIDITVNAGQGHQNVWRFEADALSQSTSTVPQKITPEQIHSIPANRDGIISASELRQIIREELAVMTALRSINQPEKPKTEPGFTEIIGGIGWIIGIAGILFWFNSYRKKA